MKPQTTQGTLLATCLCLSAVALPAQGQKEPMRLLCTFESAADPKTGTVSKAEGFNLQFLVDTTAGKTFMVGNAGVSEVFMWGGNMGMTFLEFLGTGAVQSTTVYPKDGSAVHSRHTMPSIAEGLFPSQYYGRCE